MRRFAKLTTLYLCRALGLFQLARYLTRDNLQILCYHGFELLDESRFRGGLFMRPRTLQKRLAVIKRAGFPVIGLGEAVRGLSRGNLPANALVLTIDDGFYSVYRHAAPMLKAFGFPATIYVTSYYMEKGSPVFRLAVQYMFWKSPVRTLRIPDGIGASGRRVHMEDSAARERAMWECIEYGEKQCSERERRELGRVLGQALGVDYPAIDEARLLSLMSEEEVRELAQQGFDIQLHTHRHRFPVADSGAAVREIQENRARLEKITGRPANHFCYPSGIWDESQWPVLWQTGVTSATTCIPGRNDGRTPPLGLRRFLDDENISQIEFRAELYGFLELLRRVRARVTETTAALARVPAWGSPESRR
jgi:peptidoglycan/xylan/chitin deacetylase (PgdA/CDA1 family)